MLSAPEIFQSFVSGGTGYAFEVDWWSLGVTIFEVLRGWVRRDGNLSFLCKKVAKTELASIHPALFLFIFLFFPLFVNLFPFQRPYDIHASNSVESLIQLFSTVSVQYSPAWPKDLVSLLRKVSLRQCGIIYFQLSQLNRWIYFRIQNLEIFSCPGIKTIMKLGQW